MPIWWWPPRSGEDFIFMYIRIRDPFLSLAAALFVPVEAGQWGWIILNSYDDKGSNLLFEAGYRTNLNFSSHNEILADTNCDFDALCPACMDLRDKQNQ